MFAKSANQCVYLHMLQIHPFKFIWTHFIYKLLTATQLWPTLQDLQSKTSPNFSHSSAIKAHTTEVIRKHTFRWMQQFIVLGTLKKQTFHCTWKSTILQFGIPRQEPENIHMFADITHLTLWQCLGAHSQQEPDFLWHHFVIDKTQHSLIFSFVF